jgi:TP901 family phage tail tape measure protein
MAEPIGALRAELSANTAAFERDMERAAKSVSNATRELERTARTFNSIGQRMTSVGQSLTVGITLPLAAIGVAASRAAITFESAFAGVRKTVDATDEEFAALEEGFRNLATEIPIAVNELAKIGEIGGQLGIAKGDILAFTETVAAMTVATNLSAEEAANAFARIATATGLTAADYDNLGSAIVALGNAGSSTESDIVAMAQRLTVAGAQAKLTAPEILGWSAAIADTGIQAEAGGTAFSTFIKAMTDGVAKGGEKLEYFARVSGVSAEQFKTNFGTNATETMRTFIAAFAKIGGPEQIQALDKLGLDGIRVSQTLGALALAGDKVKASIDTSNKSFREATALQKEAAERYKTTESQLKLLKGKLNDVAIEVGNALLPAIRGLVEAIDKGILPALRGAIEKFRELPDWAQVAVGIGLVAAALAGPLLLALGKVATSVSEIIRLYTTLAKTQIGVSIASWVGSLGGLSGALATAGIALGSFLIIFAKVAAAFAAGWFIGSLLREIGGFGEAMDRLTIKVWEFFNGSNKAAEQGIKWADTLSGKQRAAYDEFVKQQQEKMRLDALEAKAKEGAGAQVVATLGKVRAATAITAEQQKKAAEDAKKYSEELAAAIAKMSGASAQRDINLLAAAFVATGSGAKLTKEQAAELAEQIRKLVEQGAKIPEAFKVFLQGQLAQAFKDAEADFLKMRAAMELDEATELIGRQLTESWERVDQAAKLAGQVQVDALQMAIAEARQEILINIERARVHYEITKALFAEGKASKEALDAAKRAYDEAKRGWTAAGSGIDEAKTKTEKFAAAVALVGQAFETLGGKADSSLGRLLSGLEQGIGAAKRSQDILKGESFLDASKMQQAQVAMQGLNVAMQAYRSNALQGAAAGATFGSQFGAWGAVIGGAIGGLLGFIGSSKRAREEAERLRLEIAKQRDEFIRSAGGMDALKARAESLGLSLDALFNAKTVAEYEAAVRRLTDVFALQDQAVQLTDAAMERFGLTLGDMGPQFAQGRLDQQFAEIYRDIQLLVEQGADLGTVLKGGAEEISALVQRALAAGVALPEFMRPYIQALIDSGQLLDENGRKITDISGLKFTEPLEQGVRDLIDGIKDLINILRGIPPKVDVLVKVRTVGEIPGQPNEPIPGGEDEIPENARGGIYGAHPGGHVVRVAEGGDSELVAPVRAFSRSLAGNLSEHVAAILQRNMTAPTFDAPSLERIMQNVPSELNREAPAPHGELVDALRAAAAASQGGDIHLHNYIGGDKLDSVLIKRARAGVLPFKMIDR